MDGEGILLRLAAAELHRRRSARTRRAPASAGSSNRSGMRSCSPVATLTFLLPVTARGRPNDHSHSAGHRLAGVVDDDDLLLDRLARQEVVVLAGEARRLAADVGQQRPVVADQGLRPRPWRPSPTARRPGPSARTAPRRSPG